MVAKLPKSVVALLALVPAGGVELKASLKIDSDADGDRPAKKLNLRGNRSNTGSGDIVRCTQINEARDCYNSEKLYGFACNGWGGKSCLGPQSKCSELTDRDHCNRAWNNHKIHCVGWAMYDNNRFGQCLGFDLDAKKIKNKRECELIVHNHNDHAIGWSGERCIAPGETNCNIIKDSVFCRNAQHYGFDCLGWGGSYCLSKQSDASEITEKGICRMSKDWFNLPSRGWGGDRCITDQNAECGFIKDKAICEDSTNLLNIECGGWSEGFCHIAEPKAKDGSPLGPHTPMYPKLCNQVLEEDMCNQTSSRFGMLCAWDTVNGGCTTG